MTQPGTPADAEAGGQGETGAPPRRALFFVVMVVLLDSMGFGIVIPVLPNFVSQLGGVSITEAATIGGLIITAYAVAQFLFSPLVGALSDQFGRRPILLISTAGFALSYLVAGLATALWMLFAGRLLAGATGASFSASYAYIADITPPHQRAERFGYIGVAFGLGFIIGPALGGFLGAFDLRLPFFASALLAGLNFLLGLLFLPESLPRHLRRKLDWRRANPVGSLLQLAHVGGPLRTLVLALFLWNLGLQSLHSMWAYITSYRYNWTPLEVGLSLGVVGLLAVIVNGRVVKQAVPRFGEWQTAVIGISLGAVGYTLHALAVVPSLAFVAILVGAFGGLTIPAMQALMTARAPADAQGELQGAISASTSLTIIAGPIVFSNLFAALSGPGAAVDAPGGTFLLSVALALAALVMLHRVERVLPDRGAADALVSPAPTSAGH